MTRKPQFGFCIPAFANPGAAFFRTPAWTHLDPSDAVAAAVEAEELGYDHLWMADHLMHGWDGAIMEGWTTLSFIAGQTSRIGLGTIHLAQPFRHPAILAKMAATLDALSNGRLIPFYDCGWGEAEVIAYGLDWPSESERIARMDEGINLIRSLWGADEPLDFKGHYFHTSQAVCKPGPVQRPMPPIWLGEARGDAWLDVVARQADGFNSVPATVSRMASKLDALKAACHRQHRDPADKRISLEIQILIAPTESGLRQTARDIAALPPSPRGRQRDDIITYLDSGDSRPISAVIEDWIVGTPDEVEARMREYMELGVSDFMLWFVDFPSRAGMHLFAKSVAPRLRDVDVHALVAIEERG